MLNCINSGDDDLRAQELSLFMAAELVELAHQFKMRPTVKFLLQKVIIQQVNRENVLFFVQMAYKKVRQINALYYSEDIAASDSSSGRDPDDSSDYGQSEGSSSGPEKLKRIEVPVDPDDCIESILEEENDWLDFFYYCIDMTALNLIYIA